ncbi:coatomer subunit delta [Planococcus citri]|uniref:coatomer subunit delta n=1 Tax=Planococcus citri TaxID=170843 RepID=UPI0031F7CFFD
MVLISAAICTKAGKTLVSRQFVEMTKARIEGLLAAFPKLVPAGKQHTFVETESVRYVYQPLDKLYMLLITTKTSNILEDLETLRLFVRVIQEYCRSNEESEIRENAFNLIFAFDEIVALGYRESVYLAQIRTYVEMDSQEEKVYLALRRSQEREAKNKMREKAKELQRQRLEAAKRGPAPKSFGSYGGGSFGSSMGYMKNPIAVTAEAEKIAETLSTTKISDERKTPMKVMKLGAKSRNVDTFLNQLQNEGETISSELKKPNLTERLEISDDEISNE